MGEPAGADRTPYDAPVERTETVALPPAMLARLASLASELAYVPFIPQQSRVTV